MELVNNERNSLRKLKLFIFSEGKWNALDKITKTGVDLFDTVDYY